MAATGTPTPNLGLRIPQGTDPASVDDINYNSNLIDTKLGAVGNDSVQDQIDSLNNNISNRFKIVSSGSLHDITASGIYYLTGSVTDKPVANGGIYILSVYNTQLRVGKYISLSNEEFNIICNNSTWYIYNTYLFKYKEITGTTTSSGALGIPQEIGANRILSASYSDGKTGLVYKRDQSYFTCVDSNFSPYASTSVKFIIVYLNNSPVQET